jgi:adenylate cyclase
VKPSTDATLLPVFGDVPGVAGSDKASGQRGPSARSDFSVEERPRLALPGRPSIAVLPFTNMSADPEQEYFVDGITEDIITALSKWRWFFVIARNSSFVYKGRAVDVKQIGRQLGVRYVLEGSARRAGNRIRVNAQLIDAISGVHIWAERFDRDFTDVFVVQDELTQHVAAAIEPALSKVETELARRKTPAQLAAWDHFLRGMWHFHQFKEDEAVKAIASFKLAVTLDESLADAHAGIARTLFSRLIYLALSERETGIADVFQSARRALSFDSGNLAAHYALSIASSHSNDAEAAFQFALRATQLNDNFALGYFALAVASLYLGRSEEGLTAIDRALRLNPSDPQTFAWRSTRASALYLLGRYAEAIASSRQSLALNRYHTATRVLAASYAQLGLIDDARNAVRELLATEQGDKSIAAVVKLFMRADDREHWTQGLRAAGMPET